MFNPLSLNEDEYLLLNTTPDEIKTEYICHKILNFTDAQNSIACRYQLFCQIDGKEIWLEVKKDRALNYQLFYYEKAQIVKNCPSFLAIVGTQTLGYHNPSEKNTKQIIYNRIPKKGEIVMPVKHLISEDELPQDPHLNGYYKDANENWYFMTKRSEGTLKNFDNNLKMRSWEYKHDQNRLLIEMLDFDKTLTDITIYEGREIQRKNLKKISGLVIDGVGSYNAPQNSNQ